MTSYNFGQLSNIWTQSGGNSQVAPIMAAIALAESSGNPNALNTNDSYGQGGTQTSAGLWQISNGTSTVFDSNWSNPVVNGAAAVSKLNSQGLRAWGTYQNGSYLKYLPAQYQGEYLQNIINTYGTPSSGGTPTTADAASYTTVSSASATTTAGGMAGALEQLDRVLNPNPGASTIAGALIDTSGIKVILGRGIVTLVGVGIMYVGFKRVTGGSGGGLTGGKGLLGIATENRRISQLQEVERGNVTRAEQRSATEAAKIREQRLARLQQNRQFKASNAATAPISLVVP